jgi:hypothetical protein
VVKSEPRGASLENYEGVATITAGYTTTGRAVGQALIVVVDPLRSGDAVFTFDQRGNLPSVSAVSGMPSAERMPQVAFWRKVGVSCPATRRNVAGHISKEAT